MAPKVWDICNFARTIRLKKIFNALNLVGSYAFSLIFHKPFHLGMPASVGIEVSAICNLHCPECPTGNNTLTREKGLMEQTLYSRIISDISSHAFGISLYFQGEPMIHPKIADLIRGAVTRNLYVTMATNGQFLEAESSRKIIAAGLQRIIVSMDGLTADTYKKYRSGGDFEKVVTGIKSLAAARDEMKTKNPCIIIQFLVMKHNQHEMAGMKNLARQLGADKLVFKSIQVLNPKKENAFIPDLSEYSRYKPDGNSEYKLKRAVFKACWRAWHSTLVTWNGTVVPCCFDKNADFAMGNVNEALLKNIWSNQTYNEFRKKLFSDKYRIGICLNCTGSLFS
jgi:radical SAM protein with 4Fe4S-binding SPASM domain